MSLDERAEKIVQFINEWGSSQAFIAAQLREAVEDAAKIVEEDCEGIAPEDGHCLCCAHLHSAKIREMK
jgi:hypothetical protein